MSEDRKTMQAMPKDGHKGAPDGVNTQASSGASDSAGPYPNPHTGKTEDERDGFADGFFGHGGQSGMEYHGSKQLGSKDVKPGGNQNAGTKKG